MDTPSSAYEVTFLFFFIVAFVSIGLCASAAIKKRRIQSETAVMPNATDGFASSWDAIKRVLSCSLHGSDEDQAMEVRGRIWEENGGLVNTPPLWQRRILMGERCEMPKFSGLILYDERGCALQGNGPSRPDAVHPEKPATVATTLKDLL